jgi:hypothetical protein
MRIECLPSPDVNAFLEKLAEIEHTPGIQTILLLLGEDFVVSRFQDIDRAIQHLSLPVFGGVFPDVISKEQYYPAGAIIVGLPTAVNIHVIRDLNESPCDFESRLEHEVPQQGAVRTIFVFIDGQARYITEFVDALFNILGLSPNYIGGAAGALDNKPIPCIISNDGILKDAAIIALSQIESGVGVGHGMVPIGTPFRVTESKRNELVSLDWRPAFQVFSHQIREYTGRQIDRDSFRENASEFVFGISSLEDEYIIRAPLALSENDTIVCGGDLPEGSLVVLMHATPSNLISASAKAHRIGIAAMESDTHSYLGFFMDCISRKIFLGDKYIDELRALRGDIDNVVGATTLGEIANTGDLYLEFYNMTSVMSVLRFPEK